ncbi:MAG: hypothetical protein AAGA62_18770 [Bacteroidota bacterium]
MQSIHQALLVLHISAGFMSLGLFFIPMFARKGGQLHNRVGRVYVYGMWTVILTALLMCSIRYYQGNLIQALFLGYLALLTSQPLYHAVAILKNKREKSERMRRIDFGLRLALAVCSPVLIGFGLEWWGPGGHPLLIVFGSLGAFVAIPSIIKDLRGITKPYNWLEEHLSGMLISAIAAFTAFFSFGGNRIFGTAFSGNLQLVTWIAPTVIGVAAIRYYKYRLQQKKQ